MILLVAVVAGLAAGLARAWLGGRSVTPPGLRAIWLVVVGFLPQWLAFYLPTTRSRISDSWVAVILVGSQSALLVFAWLNRRQPGFWALGVGLVLNLLVIVLNGGMMPISPENATRLEPSTAIDAWTVGQRWGASKDVVLPVEATHLAWLSDRFLFPDWLRYRVAFSLGDAFVSLGAFLLLWSLGKQSPPIGVTANGAC